MQDAMTKLCVAVALFPGLLSVLAGCGGPASPEMPPSDGSASAQAGPQAQQQTASPSSGPPGADPAAEREAALSLDNLPAPSEPNDPPEVDRPAPEAAEPNQPGGSEPNAPVAAPPSRPAPTEPNEPVEAQPPPNAAATADAAAEGMASFYQGYAELLDGYVRANGWVDYDGLRRKRVVIKALLGPADALDPNVYERWTQDTKLAFWINVYNLKLLEIIARNYPIESSWWLRLTWPPSDIRHIGEIWSAYRFIVMDEEFTLAAVERRFFSKGFGDPRAFLAITYASRSSPPLRATPYRAEALDRQLDQQVKAFLTAGGIRIDRDGRVVHLSALFKPTWRGKEFVARFGTDKKFKRFGPETRAVLSFITRYLADDDVYFLEVENYSIEYINFDWRLNDGSR